MLIISAFPGVGKSFLSEMESGVRISDSDSSTFPKDAFPQNYMDHIKQLDVDIALISSHAAVRKALVSNKMPYFLVYPDASCKAEYMARYRRRGSPQPFIDLMEREFDNFVWDCSRQPDCIHIKLYSNQYLINVLPQIFLIAMTGNWIYSASEKRYTQEDVVGLITLYSAHLTSLDKPVTLGASENATPAIEIQNEFLQKVGLHANPNFNWPIVK